MEPSSKRSVARSLYRQGPPLRLPIIKGCERSTQSASIRSYQPISNDEEIKDDGCESAEMRLIVILSLAVDLAIANPYPSNQGKSSREHQEICVFTSTC